MLARPAVRLLVTALAVVVTLSGVLPDRLDVARAVEPADLAVLEVVPDPPMVQPPPLPHPLDRGSRIELSAQRTADSRTFQNEDGTLTTEYFAAPVHFQDGADGWVPIEAVPVASERAGVAFESKRAPVMAELGSLSTGRLLTVRAGEYSVGFVPTLPPSAVGAARAAAKAPAVKDGQVVYADVYPGVDLRYTLLPHGAKEDIILKERGDLYRFAFVLDAPGLSPRLNDDGSIDLMDVKAPVFHLPAPFMVDSAPQKDGDGVRSNDVSYELLTVAGQTVLVVEADKAWLNDPKREYPVYIDPTVTAGYGATLDTFISSAYPSYSLDAQWNPGEGGYYELWNGRYDATSGTNYAFVKTTIPSNVSVVSATFKVYVQHAYSAGTATGISIGRLTSAFSESQTWNMTHPSYVALASTTVADNQWANFNVTSAVQAWVEGTATNHGFRISQSSTSQSLWKRLRARENSTNKPSLSVTYAVPSASIVGPTGGAWTNGTALDWNFSNGGSTFSQTKFQAQVSTSSTTWSGTSLKADSGVVTSSATAWTAPTTNLTNGTTYYWRVKVFDGHSWSAWSSVASFKRDVAMPVHTSTTVGGAVTATDPNYYDLGNGTFTVAVRGSDPNSGIKRTYLRLYNATNEMRVYHDWSIGGTHCSEFDTSTLVDAVSCAQTYNSTGTREVTFTVVGLNQNASFDAHWYFTDYAGNVVGYTDSGKNLHFDATVPAGVISAPAANSTVSGSVPITGTATDAHFTQYTLHYGAGTTPSSWTSITTSTTQVSNGALGTWNAAPLANGPYTLRLRVHDKARVGSGFTEVLRPVTLDNNLPVATITDPVADAHVRGDLTITGTASASSGFESYSVHHGTGCSPTTWTTIVNSTTQVTNAPLASWDTTGLNGTYTIRLMVTKTGGIIRTATTCVTVDNTAPSAVLTSPAANTPLSGEATIVGSASDTHGFAEYELEFGVGTSPTSWTSIGIFTTPVSGDALATWSTGLLSGVHTLRLTVRDQAGNPPASVSRLVYLENGRRGNESFYTRVPFDLGGGLSAAVGVANGELTVERELFSIPSYGPPQALSLAYSSLEPSADGGFGAGWSSNLTQYLTFESGFVVWHRADGGRVPFGNVAGTWTPLAGHFETLTSGSGTYTITLKDQSKLVFADTAPGRLVRVENRFGEALSLNWGSSSATATDASGRATTLAIDAANNRITAVTDSAGRGWTFGYAGTDLTAITDPLDAITTLSYDANDRLTGVSRIRTPASGPDETIIWSFGYTAGKLTEVIDPGSAPSAHTFAYAAGETIATLLRDTAPDPDLVHVTSYAFDEWGRVTAWTDAEGWTTTQVFDAAGNLLSIDRPIDSVTGAITSYTYDARGNALTETQPIDGSTSVTTRMTYNATNDMLSRDEADGTAIESRTEYTYDAAGHLTEMEINPQLPDGPDGQIATTYTYNGNDQLENEIDALGRVIRTLYDAHGNRTSQMHNFVSGQPATADRNVPTTWAYEQSSVAGKAGMITNATDAVGTVTVFSYDALGRLTSEHLPGDDSVPALSTTKVYDQFGNEVSSVETWTGNSRSTERTYDKLNRLISETDPGGQVTSHTYNVSGDRTSSETSSGTSLFEYDGMGQVVTETSPVGSTTTRIYDASGRELAASIDGDPMVTTAREWDLAGRLVSQTIDSDGLQLTTTHEYDLLGRETAVTDPSGVRTVSDHDAIGRPIRVALGGTVSLVAYDKLGNELSIIGPFPEGEQPGPVKYTTFDALSRISTTVTNYLPGVSAPDANLTARLYYDAAGRVVASEDPTGTVTRLILNPRGLPKRTIENCTDGGLVPSDDPASCVGGGTHAAATNVVTDTTYDGQGAVLASVRGEEVGGILTERMYDPGGRMLQIVVDAEVVPSSVEVRRWSTT